MEYDVQTSFTTDFEKYGEWIIDKINYCIYHHHPKNAPSEVYWVTMKGKCRRCGLDAPKGLRFRAATLKLGKMR